MNRTIKFSIFTLLLICLLALPTIAQAKSDLNLDGDEGGTKFITNETYTLKAGKTLNGQLVALDSTVTLEPNSTVNGNIMMIGGKLNAAGNINGSLVCLDCVGNVLASAVITGNIVNPTNKLAISAEAQIIGSTISSKSVDTGTTSSTQPAQSQQQNEMSLVSKFLGGIFVVLALSALGVLVALIFPHATERVAHASIANAGISWGVGILTVFIALIAMVILSITIILSPVAALLALGLGMAVLLGWIALGYEIGSRIAASSNQKWAGPVAAGVGLLIVNVIVVAFVVIPSWVGACISGVLIFVISMFGLGAVVLTRFGTKVYPETAKMVAPALPLPPVAQVPQIPPAVPVTVPVVPPELPVSKVKAKKTEARKTVTESSAKPTAKKKATPTTKKTSTKTRK